MPTDVGIFFRSFKFKYIMILFVDATIVVTPHLFDEIARIVNYGLLPNAIILYDEQNGVCAR